VKPSYSAFDSTPLDLVLRKLEAKRLAIAGMATEMCVTDTAIAASELGYEVSVVADACASVDSDDERLALAYPGAHRRRPTHELSISLRASAAVSV
jgi:nicotinamidase-related amidase